MTRRIYIGIRSQTSEMTVFRSATVPTEISHRAYAAVVGPFETRGGAEAMSRYGRLNPHLQTVSDAERLSRRVTEVCGPRWYCHAPGRGELRELLSGGSKATAAKGVA